MYHEIICLRPTSTAAPGLGDALDLAFWGSSPPSLRQHGASAARGTRFTVSTSEARATGGRDRGGLFYTTALGHGRRLAAHRGHGSGDLVQMMVGAVILWVVLRICWALAWG